MVQTRASIRTKVVAFVHPTMVKVNNHLPSQHNTSHDNGVHRHQYNGGSIANINADGTFTHVVENDDDY